MGHTIAWKRAAQFLIFHTQLKKETETMEMVKRGEGDAPQAGAKNYHIDAGVKKTP